MADSGDDDLELLQSAMGATDLRLLRASIGVDPSSIQASQPIAPSDQDGVDLLHALRADLTQSTRVSGQSTKEPTQLGKEQSQTVGVEHGRLDKGKSPIVDPEHHQHEKRVSPVAGVAFDPTAKTFLMNSSSQFGFNPSNGLGSCSQVYSPFLSSG